MTDLDREMKDASVAAEGYEAQRALDELAPQLRKQEELAIREAMDKLDRGELSPQFAMQLWCRVHSARKLRTDLARTARVGVKAAQRVHALRTGIDANAPEKKEFLTT